MLYQSLGPNDDFRRGWVWSDTCKGFDQLKSRMLQSDHETYTFKFFGSRPSSRTRISAARRETFVIFLFTLKLHEAG